MSNNQNEIVAAKDLQKSLDVVRTSDGVYRPQVVSVVIHSTEIDTIQKNPFISADAYARIAQAAAISFQELDKSSRYDSVGKLNAVYLRMRGIWRNAAGELQVCEESMELRIEELIAEQRSKKAKQLNLSGIPIYDDEGNLLRIEYRLPANVEADLWEDGIRMRVFLERKCSTRLRARLTKALTGVTAKSLPDADSKGRRVIKVTRMLPEAMISQEPEIIEAEYTEQAAKKPDDVKDMQPAEAVPATDNAEKNDLLDSEWICGICGEIIPEKERDYFRKNPTYKRQHYSCYQQQKNGR